MARLFAEVRRKFPWFVLCAITCFGNVLPGQNQRPVNKDTDLTPIQRKIAPLIRNTSARLTAQGIDRFNAARFNVAEQFSGPLIKEIEIANEKLKRVEAWVPYEKIEARAALDFVVWIRLPDYAVTRAGSKNSEGDTILKANQVRSTLGITGAGVKVGVISDGANAAAAQARGDLASSITPFGSCVPNSRQTCNEGTAMMEIIYDLAPGVTPAIQTLQGSFSNYAIADSNGKLLLVNPVPGTNGTLGQRWIEGPRTVDFDMNLVKRVQIAESKEFKLRVDAINVLNHPRFADPNLNINNTSFGRITGMNTTNAGNRTFVLNARVSF